VKAYEHIIEHPTMLMTEDMKSERFRRRLRNLGIIIAVLAVWNGVCDYIYGYSPELNGLAYFSARVFRVVQTAGGRPHWMLMLAQTAAWLYPIYALSYYHWWTGMRRAGFWLGWVPPMLLAYAVLMIGGIQHAGWAFLSVLEQAKAVVGSGDPKFFAQANNFIVQHFFMGDLSALIALYVGTVWHGVSILSGKTAYPRWFVLVSPLGMLSFTMLIGAVSPAPVAGFILALFGTWFLLFPTIASVIWLWRNPDRM